MPVHTAVSTSSGNLLQTLLDVSLTGIILFRPVYAPQDPATVCDFAYEYLNPAAKRLLHLVECPVESFLTRFPQAADNGVFAFYCDTYLSGQPGEYEVPDPTGGSAHVVRLAAQVCAGQLVVSFLETAPATPGGVSVLLSQAAAQAARADAERQRERLHEVLLHLPASVALFHGPDLVYTLVSPGYEQLFPSRSLHGRPVREALPELVGQPLLARLEQVYRTGESCHAAETEVWVDFTGTGRLDQAYFNVLFQPLRNRFGEVDGVLNFAYNVTASVHARRELQALNQTLEARVQERTERLHAALDAAEGHRGQFAQQQDLLRQILAQVPAAVAALTGPDHRYLFFNDTYQARAGGRAYVGQPLAELFPELARQGFVALLDQVYATGQPHRQSDAPVELLDPVSGAPTLRYVDLLYQPLVAGDGQTSGILAFIVDVTDKVQARQQAEAQRQQLHDLFLRAPAPIVILDGPELVFQLVNPAFQRIFPGRTLLGRPLLMALPEIASTPIDPILQQVYATGAPYVAQEMPLRLARHADGDPEDLHFTFTYQARRGAGGGVDGVLVFAYEVTDQVRARRMVEQGEQQARAQAEAFRRNNEQLTRLNADLDSFVYAASHDLKTPITNMVGLLEALREQLPAAAHAAPLVPELLNMLDGAAARFQVTIAQLADLTRLQQVNGEPVAAVDLTALVESIRLDLAPQIQAAQARLEVDVKDCVRLFFPPHHLRSIVYNLLSNALKYRQPGRPALVQVRCHGTAAATELVVQDNGLGLSVAQQAQLFGLFQRLHAHVEGSGVGLFMVKKILDNTGGHIRVDSEPGVGTTFTVSFPHPQ